MDFIISHLADTSAALHRTISFREKSRTLPRARMSYRRLVDWKEVLHFSDSYPFLSSPTNPLYLSLIFQAMAKCNSTKTIAESDSLVITQGYYSIFCLVNEEIQSKEDARSICIDLLEFKKCCRDDAINKLWMIGGLLLSTISLFALRSMKR